MVRGLLAVNDFSRRGGGELVGIGPNGAGKTTVFNPVTVQRASGGSIRFGEELVGRTPTHRAPGVARTFQNIRLFRDLTVPITCARLPRRVPP
jgi:ABC-type branched-subunit amino acid transport system ATPase component